MNNNKPTPEIIDMGVNKNWTHVFVVNPIVALITKMIILNFK